MQIFSNNKKNMCITRKSDKDVLNFQICEYLFIKSQFNFFQNLIKQILMQMITNLLFSNWTYDLYTIEISVQFLKEN